MLFELLTAAFIQLALAWGCYGLTRYRSTHTGSRQVFASLTAVVFGFLAFLFALVVTNLVIFAQMLLLALIGLLCLRVKTRLRVFVAWSLVGLTGMIAVVAIKDFSARNEAREQYAFESLAERLAYENRPFGTTRGGKAAAAVAQVLPESTQQRLASFDEYLQLSS